MDEQNYRKLGSEKIKTFEEDFDNMVEKYKQKAQVEGLTGELKFIKERGKILIYIVI